MKKHIIAASLLLAVIAGGTLFYRQYTSVRHPVVEKGGDGWNFIYDLCIPAPMPMHCVESRLYDLRPQGLYICHFATPTQDEGGRDIGRCKGRS